MSETDIIEDEAPRRGRQPRAEQFSAERRRRKSGTLDRMTQFNLDIFAAEDLDPRYVYRWVNDEGNRIRQCTVLDDYDFVQTDELKGSINPLMMPGNESDERIKMIAGRGKNGDATHAYLLRKRKDFWEADYEEMVERREDMMAGRVYRGETTDDDEDRPGGEDKFYVPAGTQIGHAAQRRRGSIPRKTLK